MTTLNRWRNTPGRDLLIALVILYVLGAGFAFYFSRDISISLMQPLLLSLTVPMGLLRSALLPSWLTLVALAVPVALVAILIVRMPWYIRIPLFAGIVLAAAFISFDSGYFVT